MRDRSCYSNWHYEVVVYGQISAIDTILVYSPILSLSKRRTRLSHTIVHWALTVVGTLFDIPWHKPDAPLCQATEGASGGRDKHPGASQGGPWGVIDAMRGVADLVAYETVEENHRAGLLCLQSSGKHHQLALGHGIVLLRDSGAHLEGS